MIIFLTILLEFLFISLGILILFNYRKRIGLAPLYILLGSIQYFQVNIEKMISLDIWGTYPIYPGSIILISSILFAILLIYIKEGVPSARALILGIIISNFFLIGLFEITNTQNLILGNINDAQEFNINYKSFIIGSIILLADFLLLIIVYQFLVSKIKRPYFFLILFVSLFAVLLFDAIAFNVVLYSGTPLFKSSLIGHFIGKSFAALIFSIFLYLYLKFLDNGHATSSFIADQKRDIFSILQYRKKYYDLQIEKKINEEKLTAQFEKTLTSISDGIVTLDENWCYTYVNKQAGVFLGKSPEELVGNNIWEVFPEGIGLPFYAAYYKAMETQKTQYLQEFYDPFNKWFENRIYPTSNGLTIYFTDITERKIAAAEREDSFLKLKEAQRMAKIGNWEFDRLTKECVFSDQMYAILEINNDSRTNLYEAYRSKCLPADLASFSSLIDDTVKEKNGYAIDYYIKSKHNKLKYIHEIGELVKNDAGEVVKLKGTIQDITNEKLVHDELIHKNEELIKVNTELDRFVYSASHDLRAPLTSMSGLLQLLQMHPGPEEIGAEELHKLMGKTIDKMDKFIDDILDYSINSRSEIRNEKTDLDDLVHSCWENLKYIDLDSRPIFKVKITRNEAFASDKRRLKIILNNLISNAIKYYDKTKTSHYITISIAVDLDKASIVIEDNGLGIDKEQIDKIFDMFHRATKKSTGSGMGLYIVRETIDKLKGSIEVVSNLGKGTVFTVTIPNSN